MLRHKSRIHKIFYTHLFGAIKKYKTYDVRPNLLSSSSICIFITIGLPCGQTYGIEVAKSLSTKILISFSFSLSPALIAALHEKDFARLSRVSSCFSCSFFLYSCKMPSSVSTSCSVFKSEGIPTISTIFYSSTTTTSTTSSIL